MSAALDNFNSFIDGLGLSPARTSALKSKGEDFYVRVTREQGRHLRKHVAAMRNENNGAIVDAALAAIDRYNLESDTAMVEFAKALVG